MQRFWVTTTVLALVVAVAGCGTRTALLSPACTTDQAAVRQALRTAPEQVTLRDGTTLSHCISGATGDADLQNVGIIFFGVAEKLGDAAARGDGLAAVQLGYLIGATRRGASRTNGVLAELQRRVERVGSLVGERSPAAMAAIARGRAAGEDDG
jgi:hypothetical protein